MTRKRILGWLCVTTVFTALIACVTFPSFVRGEGVDVDAGLPDGGGSEDGGKIRRDGATDGALLVEEHFLFFALSTDEFGPDFGKGAGALAAGEEKCKLLAGTAKLPGQWKPFLWLGPGAGPMSVVPAQVRDNPAGLYYHQVLPEGGAGDLLFTYYQGQVTRANPPAPVRNETGHPHSGKVWTGGDPNDGGTNTCANWTVADGGIVGAFGEPGSTVADGWASAGTIPCNPGGRSIYCIQISH